MRPNNSQNYVYVVHSQTSTYHNGKEPYLQQKLLEAMAGRIQPSWHLCYGEHVWCAYWHHTEHRKRAVVDSHCSGQQLDCSHTVGRCVLLHFHVPQRCSPDVVSLSSFSLKRDFVLCSSLRKLGEDLLRSQEMMPHHLRYCSVSAGDLAEKTLLK